MRVSSRSGRISDSGERRIVFDRRVGERRTRELGVPDERRRGRDRRAHITRRETAEGHLRNAIQLLNSLSGIPDLGPDVREVLNRTVWRLHSAIAETRFLHSNRREIGNRLRRSDPDARIDP